MSDLITSSQREFIPEAPATQLVPGRDGGRTRYFLDRRPVRAGTGVELRLPGNHWQPVRLEMGPVFNREAGRWEQGPVLYLPLGHEWEGRFEARQGRELVALTGKTDLDPGRWYVLDRKRDLPVRLTDRHPPGEDGHGYPMWPDIDKDSSIWRQDAQDLAEAMNRFYASSPEVIVPVSNSMELRWPVRQGGAR